MCKLCKHEQEAAHLAVRCSGCGARQSMTFAPTTPTLKPGEPIVGPSRVPHTGLPLSQRRGPQEEPLEVTRERTTVRRALQERGMFAADAIREAYRRVPVQCGRCGGDDDACPVCSGVATAPTEALSEARKPKKRSGTRRSGSRATTR